MFDKDVENEYSSIDKCRNGQKLRNICRVQNQDPVGQLRCKLECIGFGRGRMWQKYFLYLLLEECSTSNLCILRLASAQIRVSQLNVTTGVPFINCSMKQPVRERSPTSFNFGQWSSTKLIKLTQTPHPLQWSCLANFTIVFNIVY